MNFIGHSEILSRFDNSIERNALSHAHLIIGEDGIGKSIVAKRFAAKIMKKDDFKEYIDIVNYKTTKNSFGVDEVREIITETNKRPYEGDKKVIIIYEGNKLTVQAQNALLKTIEEPPSGVYIIILCESAELILDTIKSRCQVHRLFPLKESEIKLFIEEKYSNIAEDKKSTLISFSEGIPGKVEKFIEDSSFEDLRNIVLDLLRDINSHNEDIILKYETIIAKHDNKQEDIFSIIISFVRDIIIYKELQDSTYIINRDKLDKIKDLSNMMAYKKLRGIIRVIDETRINLRSNTNAQMTFNVMMISLLEV
ncbi:DNA polymerase III subunit delta' [Clostridium folliculivorans]|uniref:DNA polymerase III subunit delta' n=1 Tax=Clostridium folliculivorans TaxID=2886038 RepID=A0A9W5Y6U8_9CLOT|nr:DNA polymerase III subunit delta' [Clostridium folliculivorans]GKU27731.1 DNA polymerase III subunit delta' [Clostridium folliculivorans]GKU32531.1 DNA polymerase III subunit delta' [Clostridium folliculivorans]